MTEDRDDRIVEFLHANAPPARDSVFRLKVMERREKRLFQRRLWTMLAGLLLILLVSSLAVRTGGGSLLTPGALVTAAAFTSGYLAFRGHLLRILKRFSL